MNREMKRRMQRQGQVTEDGTPATTKERTARPRPAPKPPSDRKNFVARSSEFLGDARGELRKVAWPTRAETINYSTIVLITLVVLITLIFFLDLAFSHFSLWLFK
jgi:preprotein translocase subunit SecE